MIDLEKQKKIMDKIDTHLRKTARRMIQFDTLDETLNYLIDSFCKQFACDYMAILTLDNQMLNVKAKKGETRRFDQRFPMPIGQCLPQILVESFCFFDEIEGKETCAFLTSLEDEQFQSWFTIPLLHEDGSGIGLCVIGFRNFVPLLVDAEKLFEEYGKDIATAFTLIRQKENETKKMQGLDWLKENLYLGGSSLQQIIENIVERAGKGTGAKTACVYLYDEQWNCLLLQSPVYGKSRLQARIDFRRMYDLKTFFPYLEKPGGPEITIPLIVNLKTIGVLHVLEKEGSRFTHEDLELLQFLASHVSAVIENARLYLCEKERQSRLEMYMHYQQELVKQTVEDDGFLSITAFLSGMMNAPVFLFDRFFHLTAHSLNGHHEGLMDAVLNGVEQARESVRKSGAPEHWISLFDPYDLGLFKVMGGGDLLGFLGIAVPRGNFDVVLRMTLNHALNVYAVQFIKQKLVLDVREQVKDSFFNQLFVENIHDQGKILEYANLLNWNIREPHCIGLFAFVFDKSDDRQANLLEEDAAKTRIWERIRHHLARTEQGIVLTRKDGCYMIIVPQEKATEDFWNRLYEQVLKWAKAEAEQVSVYIGISQEAKRIEDYYLCYKQAQKTLAILCHRFPQKKVMVFNQLGSYTVLYHLGDPFAAALFLKSYLESLLAYGKNRDLFHTLRVYLQTNGNIKETAKALFIHRSSLKYRLEKIRELLKIDIDNAEQRFNLMLAYKLYDLFGEELLGTKM